MIELRGCFLSPGSLESPSVSDFHDTEASSVSSSSSTKDELWALVLLVKEYLGVYGEIVSKTIFEDSSHTVFVQFVCRSVLSIAVMDAMAEFRTEKNILYSRLSNSF